MTHAPVPSTPEGIGDPSEAYSLLIVDDDELILSLLRDLLAGEGRYRISTATDPQRALELLRVGPFDLLIADYHMPEMTGLDLIREARRLYPDLIGILVTGFAWPEATAEAAEAGAYDLILKPFNIGEVRVTVRNACERIRLVRENRCYQRELEQTMWKAPQGDQATAPMEPIAEIGFFPPNPYFAASGPRKEERVLEQLERLGKLYQMGLLTKEEFILRKTRLFGRT